MQSLRNLLAPALVISAILAPGAHAQSPVSFELRAGGSHPTGEFNDVASPGWNVGAAVLFAPDSTWSVYAGVQRDAFAVENDNKLGVRLRIRDFGVRAGARFDVPEARLGPARTWLEAGALYHRTSIRGSNEQVSVDRKFDWGLGFEGGIGLAFPVGPRVLLSPGLRYRYEKVDFVTVEGEQNETVNYFVLDMGLNFRP